MMQRLEEFQCCSTSYTMSTLDEINLQLQDLRLLEQAKGHEFLSRIFDVIYLCIWSFMKLSTVELIFVFLMKGSRQPCLVFNQESCQLLHNGKGGVVLEVVQGLIIVFEVLLQGTLVKTNPIVWMSFRFQTCGREYSSCR